MQKCQLHNDSGGSVTTTVIMNDDEWWLLNQTKIFGHPKFLDLSWIFNLSPILRTLAFKALI